MFRNNRLSPRTSEPVGQVPNVPAPGGMTLTNDQISQNPTAPGVRRPLYPNTGGLSARPTNPRPVQPDPGVDPVLTPLTPNGPDYIVPPGPNGPLRPLTPNGPDYIIPPGPSTPVSGTRPANPRPLYPTPTPPGTTPGVTPPGGTGPSTGNPPPTQPPVGSAPMPGTVYPSSGGPPNSSFSAYNVVTDNMNNLLDSDSRYIQNSRRRGLEAAAGRGLLNSSISAGTSERAAIEAAQPILNNIMGLTSQRESQAHESVENQRNRSFQAEFAGMNAQLQNWVNEASFNREFNGNLAMLPIASAADMWSGLMQLAASDPTVFTPTVLAGYQDFFQSGFNEYISRYLQPPGGR